MLHGEKTTRPDVKKPGRGGGLSAYLDGSVSLRQLLFVALGVYLFSFFVYLAS